MNNSQPLCVRAILAEDHQLVASGIRALLAEDPRVELLAVVRTGPEAVDIARKMLPDVLLLDLQLPGMHGLDVIKELSGLTKICVLSMYNEEHYIVQAMRAGALGYVCKSAGSAALREGIQTVARGETYTCTETQKTTLRSASFNAGTWGSNGITEREKMVLRLAALGTTSQEIAIKLGISRRTAEAHRANFMKKLALKNQSELVLYALRRGLITA